MSTPTTTFITREASTQFRNITYSNRPDRVAHLPEPCACIPKAVGSIPPAMGHIFRPACINKTSWNDRKEHGSFTNDNTKHADIGNI